MAFFRAQDDAQAWGKEALTRAHDKEEPVSTGSSLRWQAWSGDPVPPLRAVFSGRRRLQITAVGRGRAVKQTPTGSGCGKQRMMRMLERRWHVLCASSLRRGLAALPTYRLGRLFLNAVAHHRSTAANALRPSLSMRLSVPRAQKASRAAARAANSMTRKAPGPRASNSIP